jgi:hypothetical protein
MRYKVDKIPKDFIGGVGHDIVFSYLPRYIDGHIIWLEKVWKRYQYQHWCYAFFPRTIKKTLGYEMYNEEGKK